MESIANPVMTKFYESTGNSGGATGHATHNPPHSGPGESSPTVGEIVL